MLEQLQAGLSFNRKIYLGVNILLFEEEEKYDH